MKDFTRKALIISSWLGSDPEEFRLGVKNDIAQIRSFLKSGFGGAFLDRTELRHLHRPTEIIVRNAIRWLKASDYAFVYYSGHGMSKRGEAFVVLNELTVCRVKTLAHLAPRQISIVDTCRNEVEPFSHFEEIGDPYGDIERIPSDFARNAFGALMQRQPMGRVLIQSGSYNQSSYSTANGGIFTSSLVKGLSRFYDNKSRPLLKTKSAFQLAKHEMQQIAVYGQVPQILHSANLTEEGLLFAIHPDIVSQKMVKRKIDQWKICGP